MRRLNPGYKLLSLIIASLLLSVTFHTRLNLLVCGTSLLAAYLTPGVNRKRLSLTLIPFVLTAAGLFTAGLFFSSGGQEGVEVSALGQRTLYATNWVTAAQLSSRVLAYGGLGLLFAFTTNSMDLVMSLMQPRAVAFRVPLRAVDFLFLIGLNGALAAGLFFLWCGDKLMAESQTHADAADLWKASADFYMGGAEI